MTSANGNIFLVIGHLWGESTCLRLNKRESKQSRRRWFESPSRSLWRHYNANSYVMQVLMLCILRTREHTQPQVVPGHRWVQCGLSLVISNHGYDRVVSEYCGLRTRWLVNSCGVVTPNGAYSTTSHCLTEHWLIQVDHPSPRDINVGNWKFPFVSMTSVCFCQYPPWPNELTT